MASAAYGSRMANEVKIFEKFRDTFLLNNRFGKLLVSLYYKHSPKLAKFILNNQFLRLSVIIALYPFAKMCKLMLLRIYVNDLTSNACDRRKGHSSHYLGLPGCRNTYPMRYP